MLRPPILMTLILWLVPPCLHLRQEQAEKVERTTTQVMSTVWNFVNSYQSGETTDSPAEETATQ